MGDGGKYGERGLKQRRGLDHAAVASPQTTVIKLQPHLWGFYSRAWFEKINDLQGLNDFISWFLTIL